MYTCSGNIVLLYRSESVEECSYLLLFDFLVMLTGKVKEDILVMYTDLYELGIR